MHMADALISPVVGAAMWAASGGAGVYSGKKIREMGMDEKKVPMMGVMGAFVFAAQMINFTIPGTGSSGHIGGGILLAALLGPFPAFLTISVVLLIQALFFADGGLIALGCNIFNMGVIPCFFGYKLIFEPILRKGFTAKRFTIASIVAVVVSLQLGAFCVVLETLASGITALPFRQFVLLMQPIHLAIGLVEGIATAAVLVFIQKMRPDIFEANRAGDARDKTSWRYVVVVFALLTVLTGGLFSLYASSHPDGLEWAIENVTGSTEIDSSSALIERSAEFQESSAIMPDYDFKTPQSSAGISGTSVAGIAGSLIVFAVLFLLIKLIKAGRHDPAKSDSGLRQGSD